MHKIIKSIKFYKLTDGRSCELSFFLECIAPNRYSGIEKATKIVIEELDDIEVVGKEVWAWQEFRNNSNAKVNWQFTVENARIKLSRLYPTLES